jgi:alpha-glutamyl/putrescinyl thymine pyrophosphorylase clade 1
MFRTLLFKLFNRIEAWKHLETICGPITLKAFDFDRYATALDTISQLGNPIYSPAYIMPSPNFGDRRKHRNHLLLLKPMIGGWRTVPCRESPFTPGGLRDPSLLPILGRLSRFSIRNRPELQRDARFF